MTNRRSTPIASPSWRRTRAHSAWKVPAWTSRPPSPTRLMIRSRSSAAARLVNVTARIRHGATPLTPDEVRDPMGQDARLARAGAGEDQQRAVGRRDRPGLLRVERADDLLGTGRSPRPRRRPGRAAGRRRPGPRRVRARRAARPARRAPRRASSRSANAVPTASAAAAVASSSVGSPGRRRRVGLTRAIVGRRGLRRRLRPGRPAARVTETGSSQFENVRSMCQRVTGRRACS